MDNFLPFSSSNANSVQELSMDLNKNRSHFSMAQPQHLLPPYSYVACPVLDQTGAMNHQPLHSSDAFPQIPVVQTGGEFGYLVCKPGVRQERGGFLDPHSTKMARINRKKAMIRSRNNSNLNSSSNELVDSRRQVALTMKNNAEIAARKDFYRFSSFDNKKLRVLLVKHLKNSDVGSLGRIVLPKMRDVDSVQSWYWSNNKSRMYVLENTGEFVKKNGVLMGDYLTIYEDESKNLYFSIRKHPHKQNDGREDESMEVIEMNFYEDIMFDYIPNGEDDSIAMLLGNLNEHYPYPNDIMDLTVDLDQHQQATSSSPPADHMSSNDFLW
ncbi:hypothetical protein HID58_075319 [Brassica napus]|uniref:TF-B3 domain-containing protein n=1 Tax=Brassica napus TaxID=3708 RepID=A0ABQ7YJJ9_BRANA|nr:hypothetical protein HID58_075319 [Brassica napus]